MSKVNTKSSDVTYFVTQTQMLHILGLKIWEARYYTEQVLYEEIKNEDKVKLEA